jgi:sodium transport system permease protein
MVVLSSVAIGPLILVALSFLVAGIEERSDAREVWAVGIDAAPTLRNYLLRQTSSLRVAPADWERALADRHLGDPVVVVAADFEAKLAAGDPAQVEVVSSSGNTRAAASVGRLVGLLAGFNREQATLRLALRGVAPSLTEAVRVNQRDLADPQARAAQFTSMLPFFVMMAVLYGSMAASFDTTAGERERGSLEPLLMNPAPPWALVLGKWGAVACVGMLIAVLSCFSFLPGEWLLRSDTLAAMFQFGPREALWFLVLLLPMAALLSALMMAVAIRCRSVKEAQANNALVILVVSIVPLITVFSQEGEKPWHLWMPALAQVTLMNRILKGEAIAASDWGVPLIVATLISAVCVVFVARQLRAAAVR